MTTLPFRKMHGTGNDFVVLDGRAQPLTLTAEQVRHLCDRHFGIGCDTLVVLEKATAGDVGVTFYNADGSGSGTCGNASRCVADILMHETGREEVTLATGGGLLTARRASEGRVTVNMGAPRFGWQDVPLSESRNTLHLGLEEGLLRDPVALSIGNPHAVFFVRDLAHIKLAEWGAKLEKNPLFAQGANISAVQILAPNRFKMAVWERGAGLTLACGSGACASVVAAVRREIAERKVEVELPGGTLTIEWLPGDDGDVLMTGPVAYVFEGQITL